MAALIRGAAGLTLAALCISAQAIGLGGIAVHSNLGQNLRATVTLIGADDDDAALRACVKARLQTLDGIPLAAPAVSLAHEAHGRTLQVSGAQKLYEPALSLVLELSCNGKSQREYTILLDPLEWPAAHQQGNQQGRDYASERFNEPPNEHANARGDNGSANRPANRPANRSPNRPAARAGTRIPASATAQSSAVPKGRAAAPVAPKAAAAPMRNVLRLSTDDAAAVAANGAAGQKARPAQAPGAAPETAADTEQKLRDVQAKLMALDPAAGGPAPTATTPPAKSGRPAEALSFAAQLEQTEQKMKEVRARILALQVETKNMSSKEPSLIPAVKAPVPAVAAVPPADNWLVTGLGVLLAACIAVIIAMVLRMRQLGKYKEHLGPY